LRYRINCYVANNIVFGPSVVAFYPINTTFENIPTFGTFAHDTLTEMRGNV